MVSNYNTTPVKYSTIDTEDGKYYYFRSINEHTLSELTKFTAEMELPSYQINGDLFVHDDMFMILVLNFSQMYEFLPM